MSAKIQKLVFEHTDKRVGAISVPVEIRFIGEDTVVVLTRVVQGVFKLEHNYPAVAVAVFKQHLEGRIAARIRFVMFIPDWIEKGVGGSFLMQPGEAGSGTMEAFGLGEGVLAENAIPMPRDGSRCTNSLFIG